MNPNSETAQLIVRLSNAAHGDRARFIALRAELAAEVEEANNVLQVAALLLDADRKARAAAAAGYVEEAQAQDAQAERWSVELGDIASAFLCEGCGEPAKADDPLEETIISPPVSGYEFTTSLVHASCGTAMAREMVE